MAEITPKLSPRGPSASPRSPNSGLAAAPGQTPQRDSAKVAPAPTVGSGRSSGAGGGSTARTGKHRAEKPWVMPDRQKAKDRAAKLVYQGGKTSIFCSLDELAPMGVGVQLYLYVVRSFAIFFTVCSVLLLPVLYLHYSGNDGHAIAEEDRDSLGFARLSLGNEGFNPDTVEPSDCADDTVPGGGEGHVHCDGTRVDLYGDETEANDVSFIVSFLHTVVGILAIWFSFHLRSSVDHITREFDATNITPQDFSLYVRGLPPHATAEQIRRHFNDRYDLSYEQTYIPTMGMSVSGVAVTYTIVTIVVMGLLGAPVISLALPSEWADVIAVAATLGAGALVGIFILVFHVGAPKPRPSVEQEWKDAFNAKKQFLIDEALRKRLFRKKDPPPMVAPPRQDMPFIKIFDSANPDSQPETPPPMPPSDEVLVSDKPIPLRELSPRGAAAAAKPAPGPVQPLAGQPLPPQKEQPSPAKPTPVTATVNTQPNPVPAPPASSMPAGLQQAASTTAGTAPVAAAAAPAATSPHTSPRTTPGTAAVPTAAATPLAEANAAAKPEQNSAGATTPPTTNAPAPASAVAKINNDAPTTAPAAEGNGEGTKATTDAAATEDKSGDSKADETAEPQSQPAAEPKEEKGGDNAGEKAGGDAAGKTDGEADATSEDKPKAAEAGSASDQDKGGATSPTQAESDGDKASAAQESTEGASSPAAKATPADAPSEGKAAEPVDQGGEETSAATAEAKQTCDSTNATESKPSADDSKATVNNAAKPDGPSDSAPAAAEESKTESADATPPPSATAAPAAPAPAPKSTADSGAVASADGAPAADGDKGGVEEAKDTEEEHIDQEVADIEAGLLPHEPGEIVRPPQGYRWVPLVDVPDRQDITNAHVADMTYVPKPRPVEDIRFTEDESYHDCWCAEVEVARPIGKAIRQFLSKAKLLKELERLHSEHAMWVAKSRGDVGSAKVLPVDKDGNPATGTIENGAEGAGMTLKQRYAQQKANEIASQLEKLQVKADALMAKHTESSATHECVGAFVVFENAASADRALEDYRGSTGWFSKHFQPEHLQFVCADPTSGEHVAHTIEVKRAAEPSNVLWENLELKSNDRLKRKCVTYLVTLLVLLATFMAIYMGSLQQQELEKATADLDLCDTDVMYTYVGTYDVTKDMDLVVSRDTRRDNSVCNSKNTKEHFVYVLDEGEDEVVNATFLPRLFLPNGSRVDRDDVGDTKKYDFCVRDTDDFCTDPDDKDSCGSLSCFVPEWIDEGFPCVSFRRNTVVGCYCLNAVRDAVSEDGLFNGLRKVVQDERDLCETFAQKYLQSAFLRLISTLVIVGVNILLKGILKWLTTKEGHSSVSGLVSAQTMKIFVAQFLNTAMITLVINASWRGGSLPVINDLGMLDGEYNSYSREWYAEVGVAICLTMLINIVVPHAPTMIQVMLAPFRRLGGGSLASQEALDEKYRGPAFDAAWRFAVVMNYLFVVLFYGGGLPVLFILAAVNFWLSYFVDKAMLLKLYVQPPAYDSALAYLTLSLLPYGILAYLANTAYMFSVRDILRSDKLAGDSVSGASAGLAGFFFDRALRMAALPLFLLFVVYILYLVAWRLITRTVFGVLGRIGKLFGCGRDEQEKRSQTEMPEMPIDVPNFSKPYRVPPNAPQKISIAKTGDLSNKDKKQGWRLEPSRNGVYRVWTKSGTHPLHGFECVENEQLLTWMVIAEQQLHTYNILKNETYRFALSYLLQDGEEMTDDIEETREMMRRMSRRASGLGLDAASRDLASPEEDHSTLADEEIRSAVSAVMEELVDYVEKRNRQS